MFTREELDGPALRRLREVLRDRIARNDAMNRGDHDPTTTARIRGRIAEATELLALVTAPAQAPDPDPSGDRSHDESF